MATKLRNLQLTSVDLVRAGANQEADICLYKSADGEEIPAEHEVGIFKRFMNWLRSEQPEEAVEKDYSTFKQITEGRDKQEKLWQYTNALTESLCSIQNDHDLDQEGKARMMRESLQQFTGAMDSLIGDLCGTREDVTKYNHYHDERGRFASASGGIAHATVVGGGSTTNLRRGTSPKDGYMLVTKEDAKRGQQVSINKYWSKDKKRQEIRKALDDFKEKNKDVLIEGGENGKFMGTWFDTKNGTLWLDVSTNFTSKSKAIKAANEAGEIAIWDVKAGGEIRLRDTHA